MEKEFYSDECGVLIGFVSPPSKIREDDFFFNEIQHNLSELYKTGRKKYTIKGEYDESNILYSPLGYRAFGDNGIVFFSLFDDFSYPNRVFHPFHGSHDVNEGKNCYQNYDWQLVVGLNTMIAGTNNNCVHTTRPLCEIFNRNELVKYPLACVTRFKINGCFLCGNGLDLTELIKQSIYSLSSPDLHIIPLNGLGGDELILISFGNTISAIADIIYKCRNLKIKDLNLAGCNDWYEEVLSNRGFNNYSVSDERNWEETHVFTSAYSFPGYAIEEKSLGNYNIDKEDDNIFFSFSWDIKPGHIQNFINDLNSLLKRYNLRKIDPGYCISSSTCKYNVSLKELSGNNNGIFNIMNALRSLDILRKHSRKLHSSIYINDQNENILKNYSGVIDINTHPSNNILASKYLFKHDFLKELRETMDKAKISKMLKEKIMKMYYNYNDCIDDPTFFVSFIELKHFLDSFAIVVKNYATGQTAYSAKQMHEWMDNNVRDFENAYLNRFHQSSRMRNLSDFNLEWNGGIQQLITSMDFVYKTLMHVCGAKCLSKFMYVSGYDRVHVTDHSYRINMHHITYPELFVSTIWKEMFNFFPIESTKKDTKQIIPLKYLCSEEFVIELKNRIADDYRFNLANMVHKTFLNAIDNEYVVSLIADALTFYYGYNCNFDDFSYWYWRHLMQASLYHGLDGELDKTRFIMFLGRILFANGLNVGGLTSQNKTTVEELRFKPFDPCLSEYWMTYFQDVYTVVQIMNDIFYYKDFFDTIKGLYFKLLALTYKDIAKNIIKETYDDVKKYYSELPNRVYRQRVLCTRKCYDSFNNNRLPIDTCMSPSDFIGSLLPAFLQYLRYLDGNYQHDNNLSGMLQRNENGFPDLDSKYVDCYSNILMDALGGTFVINGYTQKKYFAARSTLYLMMFHFCEKHILSIIKES